ncbi:MAG: hypothetical protein CTY29_08975 [Methylobacter sp.]|nr:MAG: hypothetical protein CTY29_08975 [Methylobacter sp.]
MLLFWLILMIAVGFFMAWLGRACLKASLPMRVIFRIVSLSAIIITAVGAYASIQFPSHELGNTKMPPASLLHSRLILVSIATAVLLPLWLTLGISSFGWPNLRTRKVTYIIVGIAGVFSMVGAALAVFIGCNDAGVCF